MVAHVDLPSSGLEICWGREAQVSPELIVTSGPMITDYSVEPSSPEPFEKGLSITNRRLVIYRSLPFILEQYLALYGRHYQELNFLMGKPQLLQEAGWEIPFAGYFPQLLTML